MARRKSKKATIVNQSALTKWVTNPLSLVIVITFGCLILTGKLWSDYRSRLATSDDFRLSSNDLHLTEPPIWLSKQSLNDCANRFDWQDRFLLQTHLVRDIAHHLSSQSWVKKVVKVQKTRQGIQADVQYRIPIAMIEITMTETGDNGLVPVDSEGYILDGGDVAKNQIPKYFRIAIERVNNTNLQTGKKWPDKKVVFASQIAHAIQPMKDSLQIDGIYGYRQPESGLPEFRLWTEQRDEIVWGSPIGQERGQEADLETKLKLLAKLTPEARANTPGYRPGGGNVFDLRLGLMKTAALPEISAISTKRF